MLKILTGLYKKWQVSKMRDKLIKLLKQAKKQQSLNAVCGDIDSLIDSPKGAEFIADYLLANGVVALPYEEGQPVYVLRSKTLNGKNLYLKKEIISHYRIFKDRAYMFFESGGLSVCDNLWKETVFLTEEEAERALKEVSG